MKYFGIALWVAILVLFPTVGWGQSAEPCSPGAAVLPDLLPADGTAKCRAATRDIACDKNGGYVYTFSVTNNTGGDVTSVLVTPPPGSGYTITPQMPPLSGGVLHHGQSTTLQVKITGGQPGQTICFPVTLMGKNGCCTIQVCVTLPNCCATFNEPKITCNKDGSYSYTFTVTNKTGSLVQHIYLHAPAGTTITPSYFPVNLGSGATSAPLTVTIAGAKPGKFCFRVSLHTEGMKTCCVFDQCIELPPCGTANACAAGACCSRPPAYDGTKFVGQKVAAVTGKVNPPKSPDFVLTVFDMSGANGWGVNASTPPAGNVPPQYNGPAGKQWTAANLGSVFGVDMDHLGNIYVTASVAFTTDVQGPGTWGGVYRIDNGTGAIQTFAQLPNTPDSNGLRPALGDVAFACPRKELFVTNMDDGRIYRLDLAGTVLSTFDHFTSTVTNGGNPEPGDAPGVAPLGERLWAVQYHDNRVYYSVWNEDCGHMDPNRANEIWSVGLDVNGEFVPGTRRLETPIPSMPGGNYSNPVSDIAFGRDGRMLVSERSMRDVSTTETHSSRVLEFSCVPEGWTLTPAISGFPYRYNVGEGFPACAIPTAARPSNAAGGIDYDFDGNATWNLWATGDALQFSGTPQLYGFQGFKLAGGSKATSPLLAVYGHGNFKTMIGDIEISCPPFGDQY
ncbi:MAG TPA: hypothetical protein VGF28_09755 [Thermoanaerobaculia bacterium]|jgi:hypothetical protein